MSYGGGGYGGGGYGQQGGYGQGGYGQGGYGQGGYNQGGGNYGSGNRYEPNRYQNNQQYGGNQGGGGGGYGQSANPYGGGNQYSQQAPPPPAQNRYDQGGYGGNQNGAYSDNVEMGQVGRTGNNKLSLFQQARDIQNAVKQLAENDFPALQRVQKQHLDDPDPKRYRAAVDNKQQEINHAVENLRDRLKVLMKEPNASPDDRAEIKRSATKLQELAQTSVQVENAFRKKEKENRERQYKITNPRATQAEVAEAVDSMEQDDQVFQQSLMNADRRGHAATALGNVRSRHEEIIRIEKSMSELTDLFIQTNEMVVQQEEQVNKIQEQAQNVEQDVGAANTQLDGAIVKARAARKKKWICLGIVATIILIIIIAVVIYVVTHMQNNSGGNNNKSG